MQRTIIVTDLTRFSKKEIVCTAGVDRNTGECIRPMPYLSAEACKNIGVLPGAILTGNFVPAANRSGPHQEDCNYSGSIIFNGACSSSEFKDVLAQTLSGSVAEGFGFDFDVGQKALPPTYAGHRSIITIPIAPSEIEIVEDQYNPGKIKLIFRDQSGHSFRYIPVTDLGFYDYAMQHHQDGELEKLNAWLRSQGEIFLRVGLSRVFAAPNGINGFWLQANGIYTFPDYNEEIRSYSK